MKIVQKLISELNPAPYNPRSITDSELQGLIESLKKFGFVEPVVFNTNTRTMVGGHQRVKAAQMIGMLEVPTFEVDLSLAEEKALNIALNSHTIAGKFDGEILHTLIDELQIDCPELAEAFRFDQLAKDLKIDFTPVEEEKPKKEAKEAKSCPHCGCPI